MDENLKNSCVVIFVDICNWIYLNLAVVDGVNFNIFEDFTFFIPTDQKIDGFEYGVLNIATNQLHSIIDCVDLIAASFPIPQDMRVRLETKLTPRMHEIADFLDTTPSMPAMLGIELSRLNRDDFDYGLKSTAISKQMASRGYNAVKIRAQLGTMNFLRCKAG